ncbi:MAG TPA: nucleotidyltransferase family protein [Terriglobales bacterium]|nr:nucleotidyltransferase family protein [Terriglobales bacterium]
MSLADSRKTQAIAEWELLVECVSAAPRTPKLEDWAKTIAWENLLGLAEDHGVLGQVATQLGGLGDSIVPREAKRRLTELHRGQLFSALRMSGELFRLAERFAAANIGMLTVKGPALAVAAYGDPGMRSYGDIDLLVRPSDIYRATEIMIADGFDAAIPLEAIRAGKIPGQYLFSQRDSKLLVELHNDRTLRYFPRPLRLDELFQRQTSVRIDGREVPTLSVEDTLVLISVHGAKHFWDRLMWIADVGALVSRQSGLHWQRVNEAAREVGAERMVNTGLCLAGAVLGTSLPARALAMAGKDRVAKRLAEQVVGWLGGGENSLSLLERAFFRMRMRGEGLLAGAGYLLKLSLSPTEEDWEVATQGRKNRLLEAAARPFRLARKYGKSGKN